MSLLILLIKTARPHYAILGKIPNEPHYKNVMRFPELETSDDTLIIRFDAGLYFANISYFKAIVKKEIIKKGEKLKAFFLNADSINNIDTTAIHALEEILEECRSRGIEFYIIAVKGPVRDALKKSSLMDKIGRNYFFLKTDHAVNAYRNTGNSMLNKYAVQNSE